MRSGSRGKASRSRREIYTATPAQLRLSSATFACESHLYALLVVEGGYLPESCEALIEGPCVIMFSLGHHHVAPLRRAFLCRGFAVASLLERAAQSALQSASPVPPSAVDLASFQEGQRLLHAVKKSSNLMVVTGAGISTASGIPSYRRHDSPEVYTPLKHQDFMTKEDINRRYWARSFIGYPRMAGVKPNHCHHALSALERVFESRGGRVFNCTQNVDRLLQRADCRNVLELHGTIHTVECLSSTCGHQFPRSEVQERMASFNARWHDHWSPRAIIKPDGDAELPAEAYASFCVPNCPVCRVGKMKPIVVFHGASIPRPVVDASLQGVEEADAFLLVGSTATVFSCFRLVRRAKERGIPVGVINVGPTRADPLADFKIEKEVGSVLEALVKELAANTTTTAAAIKQ